MKRLERCRISGHHSVMDHYCFTFLIEDCPKILARFLNNEKEYTTSEKSARYTKIKADGKEKELYENGLALKKNFRRIFRKNRRKASNKTCTEKC